MGGFSFYAKNEVSSRYLNRCSVNSPMFVYCLSEIFGDGTRKILVEGREVKALCLFKKGITPEWEDERNRDGAEFNCIKVLTPDALDLHWENIIFSLIGEVLDEEENICGVRLVHQGKKMKGGFKIEVWLRKRDEEIANKVKVKLAEALGDSNEKVKPSFRINATDFSGWQLHSTH